MMWPPFSVPQGPIGLLPEQSLLKLLLCLLLLPRTDFSSFAEIFKEGRPWAYVSKADIAFTL